MPIEHAERDALIEALNHLLGNGCRLFRVSKCCSWNAQGEYSIDAQRLFGSQAEEIWVAQNDIARQIRRLGGEAVPDDTDGVVVERPQDLNYMVEYARLLALVISRGHQNAMLSLRAADDVASEVDDEKTSRTLSDRLKAHARHLRELESFGEGVAVALN